MITLERRHHTILIVIPWARVVCPPEARGPQAQGLRVDIAGKPRVHMV